MGTPGTFTVTTTGIPTPTLSETGALPTGVTFVDNRNGTATLAGTPAAGTGGTYPLTITAANGVAARRHPELHADGRPAPGAGDHQRQPATTFTVGTAGTFTVTTTGFPTPTLTETGALPTGVTFVDNHDGTPRSRHPGGGHRRHLPLTITAANGVGSDATQSFTLTVNPATPTLVGYWRFDDGTGTVATDSSGQQPPNNGTLVAGPTWTTGKVGGALALDGSNDLVDVHDSPSLEISGGITLAAWIKPNAVATQRVITKDYGTANGYELSLSSSGHAFVRFDQATSGDTYRLDANASYPTDGNTWVHLAATYDGATIKIYVNGVLDNSKATTFTIGTNNVDLGLGADVGSGSGTNTLKGQMDEVRIYNRALSDQDIQALTVSPAQAPAITTPAAPPSGGHAGSFTVTATAALQPRRSARRPAHRRRDHPWSEVSGPGTVTFANPAAGIPPPASPPSAPTTASNGR